MFGLRILYSGEFLYFANSASQSSLFIGGNEPVTGLHSVILSLIKSAIMVLQAIYNCGRTQTRSILSILQK